MNQSMSEELQKFVLKISESLIGTDLYKPIILEPMKKDSPQNDNQQNKVEIF